MSNDYPNQPSYGPGGGMPPFGATPPPGMTQSMGTGMTFGGSPADGKGSKKKRKASKAPKPEKAPTRRSANSLRWLFLVFAAVLAVLAILLVTGSNKQVYVVRANKDLAAMTNVTEADIEVAVFTDEKAVEPDTFHADSKEAALAEVKEKLAGHWLSVGVKAQQQLRKAMFTADGGITPPLAADERLISINASASRAVAGTLHAGDRVDVYVSNNDGLSGLLAQGVQIVSISIPADAFASLSSQQIQDPEKDLQDLVPTNPVPGTYVIRIKAADVAKYIAAGAAGQLHLSLRGKDAEDVINTPTDLVSAICADPAAIVSDACQRAGAKLPSGASGVVAGQ